MRLPCQYVLLAQQVGDRWERLLLQRISLDLDSAGFDLVWNPYAASIGWTRSSESGSRARRR